MKNLITLFCLSAFLLVACGNDKTKNQNAATESPQEIQTIEAENEKLNSLNNEIEADIKDLDMLLEELEN